MKKFEVIKMVSAFVLTVALITISDDILANERAEKNISLSSEISLEDVMYSEILDSNEIEVSMLGSLDGVISETPVINYEEDLQAIEEDEVDIISEDILEDILIIEEQEIQDVSNYSKNTILHISYPLFKENEENSQSNNLNDILAEQIQKFINLMNERYDYIQEQETEFKPEFTVKTVVNVLEERFMFIKFELETKYITNSENVKSYEMVIYDMLNGFELSANQFLQGDYSEKFYLYAKDYFYENYSEDVTEFSDNYFDIEARPENYTRIFISEDYAEVPIYDYFKKEEILLNIHLRSIADNIKDEYSLEIKQKYIVQEDDTEENIMHETENSFSVDTYETYEIYENIEGTEPFMVQESQSLVNSTNLLIQAFNSSVSKQETQVIILTEMTTETTTQQINVIEVVKEGKEVEDTGRNIDKNKPMVALTFDDGPNSSVTSQILDILDRYNAVATFFIAGTRIETEASILQRMVNSGHQIENHTFSHRNLTQLTETQIINELELVDQKLYSAIGQTTTMVRVPYGAINDKVKSAIDYPIISWSVDPRDWESRNALSVQNAVLNTVKDGDIVLMHDLYKSTADACEVIIPELVNRGYQLVTVEELYYYRDINLENNKVYSNAYKK